MTNTLAFTKLIRLLISAGCLSVAVAVLAVTPAPDGGYPNAIPPKVRMRCLISQQGLTTLHLAITHSLLKPLAPERPLWVIKP